MKLLALVGLCLQAGLAAENVDDLPLFPLADGNQWALSNPFTRLPAYITVVDNHVLGGKRFTRLRVDVPFSSTTLILSVNAKGILFEGVASGEATSYFDEGLPLFSADNLPGETWSNDVGSVTLVADDLTIRTPAGVFEHCRHFRLDLVYGGTQDWFLAPGIGVVRFGESVHPFLLDIANVQPYQRPAESAREGLCPRIGLDANPAANQSFSDQSQEDRLNEALRAGHSFQNLSATWAQMEPTPGDYDFKEIRKWIKWAEKYGFDVTFTLKTVDTSVVAVPADLAGRPFDDPELMNRFSLLLRALAPELGTHVKWIQLANEVDTYFLNLPRELPSFLAFFEAGKAVVKELRPDTMVGVVFAENNYRRSNAVFKALSPLCDHITFTYYPLTSGTKLRPPAVAGPDIAQMVKDANGKPVLFTEIGYASSEAVSGGPEAQREFYENVFAELRAHPDEIVGASFFLMSDIPPDEVSSLAMRYGLESNGPFVEFLGSLGLHDVNGIAKPAWDVFSTEAVSTRNGAVCRADAVSPLVATPVSTPVSTP